MGHSLKSTPFTKRCGCTGILRCLLCCKRGEQGCEDVLRHAYYRRLYINVTTENLCRNAVYPHAKHWAHDDYIVSLVWSDLFPGVNPLEALPAGSL